MTARLLDGKALGATIRAETAQKAATLKERGLVPGLTAVLVGEDPASRVYVKNKTIAAAEAGLAGQTLRLAADCPAAELEATIDRLNADDLVDGILLQLPLPKHLKATAFLDRIRADKDVDGFHPENVGRLHQGREGFVPCTPAGVMELLRREGIALRGQRAVVLGRSDIVGKPMAALLVKQDATVTVCHSKTRDLPAVCREADVLVAAIGKAGFVTGEFVKEGAAVIDVGINRVETEADLERFFPGNEARKAEFAKKGSTLVGDCDPHSVMARAGAFTPVPGGVGPLTIAMLLANTVLACERRRGNG